MWFDRCVWMYVHALMSVIIFRISPIFLTVPYPPAETLDSEKAAVSTIGMVSITMSTPPNNFRMYKVVVFR